MDSHITKPAGQKGEGEGTTKKKTKGKNKKNKNKSKSTEISSKKPKPNIRQSDSGCLASSCLDLAVAYISLLRTKVANYQKQVTRISKLTAATMAKANKQNAFANAVNQIMSAGGGDLLNLSCGASTNNTGIFV